MTPLESGSTEEVGPLPLATVPSGELPSWQAVEGIGFSFLHFPAVRMYVLFLPQTGAGHRCLGWSLPRADDAAERGDPGSVPVTPSSPWNRMAIHVPM